MALTVWINPSPEAEATGQLTTMDPARIERRALHFVPRGNSAVIRPDPVATGNADPDVRGAALTGWRNAFGAGVGTVSEMLWPGTPVSGFSETLAPPAVPVAPPDTRPLELVVIDGAVDDAEQLVAGLNLDASRRFEVVMLDSARDGVDQITELLASRSDVSALHIVSHGAQGILQLGTTLLDTDSLSSRAAALTQLRQKRQKAMRVGGVAQQRAVGELYAATIDRATHQRIGQRIAPCLLRAGWCRRGRLSLRLGSMPERREGEHHDGQRRQRRSRRPQWIRGHVRLSMASGNVAGGQHARTSSRSRSIVGVLSPQRELSTVGDSVGARPTHRPIVTPAGGSGEGVLP
jgi:hypothetical protein